MAIFRFISSERRKKSYSSAAHFEQHFNSTIPRKYLSKCMALTLVNQLNPVGAMKEYKEPNCKIFMEEHLTILKRYVKNVSRS